MACYRAPNIVARATRGALDPQPASILDSLIASRVCFDKCVPGVMLAPQYCANVNHSADRSEPD